MEYLFNLLYFLIMLISDLTFLHSARYKKCNALVDKHFDGYCSLQFMDTGVVDLAYDSAEYQLNGAYFWPAFPGPRIRFNSAKKKGFWSHRYAAFKGPLVARWTAFGLFPDGPCEAPPGRDWAAEFDQLLAAIEQGGQWSLLRAINLLEGMLIALAQWRSQTPSKPQWLDHVLHAADASVHNSPDYQAIADELNLSLPTLRRQFRQAVGVPLHAYALQCKVGEARRLLGEADLSIKQVAQRLGYLDVYFFTKQFHHHVGITPAQYRKSRQL